MPILAMAALAAAAVPRPGDLKTFRDWIVGCDNGRACHATSLLRDDDDWEQARTMRIRRGPGATADPEITLLSGQGEQQSKPASLSADGKRLPVRFTENGEGDAVIVAGNKDVLAALRSASTLEVLDAQGRRLARISLAGTSAALLYMDEVQKRIGTVTALARPGAQPASTVPAPPAIPVVRSAAGPAKAPVKVDAARIAALRKQHGCEAEQKDWPGYGVEQEPLDADHSLILLGCGSGAYNSSEVPLVATRNGGKVEIAIAGFDLPPLAPEEKVPMLVNSSWAPNEQVLTSFSKGRGIGDCGIGRDYGWDGTRFRLVQQIEMDECRGSMDYVTTWRATLVKK